MDNRYELQQLATPRKRGAPSENLCLGAPGQCPTQPQHTTPIWRLTGRFKNSSKNQSEIQFSRARKHHNELINARETPAQVKKTIESSKINMMYFV